MWHLKNFISTRGAENSEEKTEDETPTSAPAAPQLSEQVTNSNSAFTQLSEIDLGTDGKSFKRSK